MFFRLFIIMLFLWGSAPAIAAAARLNFGAAPGTTSGVDSEQQARRLAADLAEALDSEMALRLFDDQRQLGQWLNDFAMIDLGIMDAEFLAAHPGEFLVLGPMDQSGRLFAVARQGATGDMPKRVAAALRRSGAQASPRLPEATPPRLGVVDRPPSVPSPATVAAAPLIIGLVPGPDALVRDTAEADRFATELGERLGVPLRPRLFASETALADWFLRFRMVDLAVIGEPARRDPLVGDYQRLQRLVTTGGAPVLLVARRDLPADRLQAFARVLTSDERPALAVPPAAPEKAPAEVVAAPAPVVPSPPEPPAWPVVPEVPALPALPAAPPAPALPPLPELPVAPVASVAVAAPAPPLPEIVAAEVVSRQGPVASLPTVVPAPEVPVPVIPPAAEPVSEAFQMPASTAPILEDPTLLADLPPVRLPMPAAPVVEVPVPVAPVEPVAVESVPAAIPELPFIPVPPREVAEAPVPTLPVVESRPVEPPVAPPAPVPVPVAPVEPPVAVESVPTAIPELPFIPVPPREVAEAPVPTLPVVESRPVEPPVAPPAPAMIATAESPPEVIPGLPFVPVPPRTIAEATPPVRVADEPGTPADAGAAAVQEAPAVTPADSPWVLSGAGAVPAIIAQPDLPQELRPPGVPLPRPGRLSKPPEPAEEPVLLAKLQEPLTRTPKPPPLLAAADPEPGVIYVLPFISLMVPPEVQERVFDQFVDTLNQRGAEQKLKFVIVKQGLDKTDRAWLAARKHALGEIYGYVEESGCCSTDLRTRVRLTYYRAHQAEPALKYEYPVRKFFDHDRSTLVVERQKLADQIAGVLVEELFKAVQP